MNESPPSTTNRPRLNTCLVSLAAALAVASAAPLPLEAAEAPLPASTDPPSFRDLLIWSDILPQSLGKIPATPPESEDERQLIEQVLFRLARARPDLLDTALPWPPLGSHEAPLIGDIVELRGRVVQVDHDAPARRTPAGPDRQVGPAETAEPTTPPAAGGDAQPTFRCVLQLSSTDHRAVVWANHVPEAWLAAGRLNERASVRGAFAGVRSDSGDSPTLVLLADRVAWHPDDEGEIDTTLGRRALGDLGVDVGRLDEVRHRAPLSRDDRQAFYEILAAVAQSDPQKLLDLARGRLDRYAQPWHDDVAGGSGMRKLLGRTVIQAASEGRYSVAPLFLDAERQTGQLLLLEGIARRAIRIETAEELDHYYELEIFTPDSQNLPIVCCVPSLPAGFPVGDAIREPVQVAGFFYKLWQYDSRSPRDSSEGPLQFEPNNAPLLIAAEPRRPLARSDAASDVLAWITAAAFVAGVVVLGWLVWWWSREDRRLRRRRFSG